MIDDVMEFAGMEQLAGRKYKQKALQPKRIRRKEGSSSISRPHFVAF